VEQEQQRVRIRRCRGGAARAVIVVWPAAATVALLLQLQGNLLIDN